MQAEKYRDLNLLWPVFKSKVEAGLKSYRNEQAVKGGLLQIDVFETWRSMDRMCELWKQGRETDGKIVTYSKPGHSWHYFGLAVDIVFRDPRTKNWSWLGDWEKVAPHFVAQGLEWLGQGPKFVDKPHFELTGGMKVSEALAMQQASGLQAVWLEVERRIAAGIKGRYA